MESVNQIKISVIIPCYNVEKYVGQCIESVVNQTIGIEKLEIILVDDRSNDSTLEILHEYEKEYSNNVVLVERKENGGLSAARNTGLKIASGDYVLFVDSDDYLCEAACQLLYDRAIKETADVVSGGMVKFCGADILAIKQYTDATYYLKEPGELKKYLLSKGEICSACANIYKREFLAESKILFQEGFLMEDVAFFMDVFNFAEKTSNISESVYMYRSNSEGIMQSKVLQGAKDGHFLVTNRYDKYKGTGWSDTDREIFEWYLFYKGFYTPISNILISGADCDDNTFYKFAQDIVKRIPNYKSNRYIIEMLEVDDLGIAEFLEFVSGREL